MSTYTKQMFSLSNSSKLSLHLVGGYGILAIPTILAVQSWQSGYGRDAIPSYRYIYKKNNHAASTAAWLSINSKVMTISFYSLRRYY